MRGLKHQKMIAQRQHDVASFTDAWIETTFTIKRYTFTVCRIFYRCVDWNILIVLHSYLFLGRIFYRCVDWNGMSEDGITGVNPSHLLQMRGLKPWWHESPKHWPCRIFYRCVDWNQATEPPPPPPEGRIFYRCVDWNTIWAMCPTVISCRIFYRCVDWNADAHLVYFATPKVASFTDAWIETLKVRITGVLEHVASFTDAWIETSIWK